MGGRRAETRIAITVRLPYDQYREVAQRARQREWSLSHYISHCIGQELGARRRQEPGRVANHALDLVRGDDGAVAR